jgi:hypothetical protein
MPLCLCVTHNVHMKVVQEDMGYSLITISISLTTVQGNNSKWMEVGDC